MYDATTSDRDDAILRETEELIEQLAAVRDEIGKAIFGQERVIDETLTALLAGGHILVVGVPGLAKTLMVETLGTVFGLSQKRVQFTPDLMPADILGSEILEDDEHGRRSFRFLPGPVFSQLLMADEINRASPRTQAALLQSMQEKRVTVAGHDHELPKPFHVLATQNPIEQEGTYPLPEAQLDRFLLQINVDYPDIEAERRIVLETTTGSSAALKAVMDPESLIRAQQLGRRIPVGEQVVEAILRVVRAGRPDTSELEDLREHIAWGPGPRASQAMVSAARVRALLHGRLSPSVDDVIALAHPILRHRMALTFTARAEGITLRDVIDRLCQLVR
ncbi:MAG: AAA family ATPase [Geminicoccaceae bacterium]